MTTSVQRRRGTTVQHSTFTGLEGELTVDTSKDTAVIHDGATVGGFPLAKEGLENTKTTNLTPITGADTAADDTFLVYDTSASAMKKITRAELNNAIEKEPLSNVTINSGSIDGTAIGATTASTGKFSTLTNAGLTATRITYAGTAGLLQDSANLTFNGTTLTAAGFSGLLTGAVTGNASTATALQTSRTIFGQSFDGTANVTGSITSSSLTSGRVTYATTGGLLTDSANMVFDGSTLTTLNSAYTGTLTGGTGVVNLGSGQFYKDASGNVGIGTSSPQSKLNVYGSAGSAVVTLSDVTLGSNYGAQFKGYGVAGNGGYAELGVLDAGTYSKAITVAHQAGYVAFNTGYSGASTNAERMRIDSAGRIGFGSQGTTSDRLIDAAFSGATLAAGGNQFGLVLNPTYPNTATANLFNIYAGPNIAVGATITNVFGVYVEAINSAGSTVTNKYGIYQAGASDQNLFTGNVKVNNGITFPVTQSASSDAKTLDDYEEGTFTPTLTAASGTNGGGTFNGSYVKIGRYVMVTMTLISISKGTLSGKIGVGNLPFPVTVTNSTATCRWDFGGGSPTAGTTIVCPQCGDGGTVFELQMFGGSGYLGNMQASNLGSTFNIYNITYSYLT